jgi:DNA primase
MGRDRLDWSAVRDRVDLANVAAALLGPAAESRGRRLFWRCPFHADRHPSFEVDTERQSWKCWPCNLGGDVVELVRRLEKLTSFSEAARRVAELAGGVAAPSQFASLHPRPPTGLTMKPAKPASPLPDRSSGLRLDEASSLVYEAARRLWEPEGIESLTYLRRRGLRDETIRANRLGIVDRISIPTRNGDRYYRARGVVIPWFDGDRLALVKIRQPEGTEPKYVQAYGDRPQIFPGPEAIEPGHPLVVVEGELDSLLLAQELRYLTAVVTLGSASRNPNPGILVELMPAAPWFLALDGDEAGEKAAAGWPARAVLVRPPGSWKDWTEAAQAGVNLRRWWSDRLAATEAPPLFTWDELAAQRWGPALREPNDDGPDPYDAAEREAIQSEAIIDPTAI